MEDIKKELQNILGIDGCLFQEPMAKHTTFQTGGNADLFLMPKNIQALQQTIAYLQKQNIFYEIVGNGSNLLVGDGGIRGAVIQLYRNMQDIVVCDDILTIQCGALLSMIAAKAADAGLTGMEFASGIPGTFGGAVVMNAGAYGGECKDILVSVDVLTKDLEVLTLTPQELDLGYRHSNVIEQGYIVLGGKIKLQKGNTEEIAAKMTELAKQRREKQPLQYPSAGSTFKRPEGHFAGKLISDAGLKGKQIGGAAVSEKHAGFIVNVGQATTKDILDLMALCQKEVLEKFGVVLEPEVKFLGEQIITIM